MGCGISPIRCINYRNRPGGEAREKAEPCALLIS
jgi:hypothetical protein